MVLVSFEPDILEPSKSKETVCFYHIGQIQKQLDSNNFEGTFIRSKNIRDCKGFVYGFPDVRDM